MQLRNKNGKEVASRSVLSREALSQLSEMDQQVWRLVQAGDLESEIKSRLHIKADELGEALDRIAEAMTPTPASRSIDLSECYSLREDDHAA